MVGLTLARRIAQRGHAVHLIESAPQLGGLAAPWSIGEYTWDRHYHVTLLSDLHLRRLLEELDLEREMKWVTTRTGCYTDGRLYSVSNSLEFLRFPPLRLVDKLRLGATIAYAARVKDWRRLESIPVGEWLTALSGRRTFERFWLPLLRSKLGEAWRETSAAFIWTTIARLYAARRSGLKRELFGYLPGGYARIVDRFRAKLEQQGVAIRVSSPVASIERTNGGLRVTTASGEMATFDGVVVTLAAPLAASLCRGLAPDELDRLRAVRYLGIVCASVVVPAPLGGFYVTNITDGGVPFTGVVEMTTLVDRAEFGGNSLVYLPKYVTPGDPLFFANDAEIEDSFLPALAQMFPGFERARVRAFRVSRVSHVCAIPTLGYSERLPPVVTSVPGLYLLGSAHIVNGTLNVNESVKLAESNLDRILQ